MEIRNNLFDFYTLEEWENIIEDHEKSGLSIADYCKKEKYQLVLFMDGEGRLNRLLALILRTLETSGRSI